MRQPAFCTNCNHLFLSSLPAALNGTVVLDCAESCPICGADAFVSNSQNEISIVLLNFLYDKTINGQIKKEIAEKFIDYAKGDISEEQIRHYGNKIGQKATNFINSMLTVGGFSFLVTIAGLIFSFVDSQEQARQHGETVQIEREQNEILFQMLHENSNRWNSHEDEPPMPQPRPITKVNEKVKQDDGEHAPNRKARRKAKALERRGNQ